MQLKRANFIQKPLCLILLASLVACGTYPLKQPSVLVVPHPEIALGQFVEDEQYCKANASVIASEEHEQNINLDHISVGGVIGALTGLLVPGGSSLMGFSHGIVGALTGLATSLIGIKGPHRVHELSLLNIEYQRCMYMKGHVVPGLPILGNQHKSIGIENAEKDSEQSTHQ